MRHQKKRSLQDSLREALLSTIAARYNPEPSKSPAPSTSPPDVNINFCNDLYTFLVAEIKRSKKPPTSHWFENDKDRQENLRRMNVILENAYQSLLQAQKHNKKELATSAEATTTAASEPTTSL